MQTFWAAVFVFGLLIIFHELGHFLFAKAAGVKVHEFSIGFGPKLFGIPRKETAYNLRLFPLGGFVRMAGMDPE
ncbi:MAG: site-2 protease family protein, partial [Desulfotomaculales bacterium]